MMKLSKLEVELKAMEARRAEVAELEKQIGVATQVGDIGKAKPLRQRLAEIQTAITEGEHLTLRLALQKREADLPEAEAELHRLTEQFAERQTALAAAQVEHEQAKHAYMDADTRLRSLRYDIADARREIARQDREAVREMRPAVAPATPYGWRS